MMGPGPRLMKKDYRAAVSQRLRNTGTQNTVRAEPEQYNP